MGVALDDIVGQLARQPGDVAGSIRADGLIEREMRTWSFAMRASQGASSD